MQFLFTVLHVFCCSRIALWFLTDLEILKSGPLSLMLGPDHPGVLVHCGRLAVQLHGHGQVVVNLKQGKIHQKEGWRLLGQHCHLSESYMYGGGEGNEVGQKTLNLSSYERRTTP